MTLILSPIPQILFYKKREQQDKIAPVALVFYTEICYWFGFRQKSYCFVKVNF